VVLVATALGLIALPFVVPRGWSTIATMPAVPLGVLLVVLGVFSDDVREIRGPGFVVHRILGSRDQSKRLDEPPVEPRARDGPSGSGTSA
jgi:hypothetical protein